MFKRLTNKTLLQALLRACFVVLFVVSAAVGLNAQNAKAAAGIPLIINYQARVTSATGTAITAATNMRFVIWDSLSGGSCVWSGWGTGTNGCTSPNASQVSVTPVNGVFSIPLGDTTLSSQNALQNTIFNDDSRYLEIQMYNGSTYETLSPRKRILAAPYAMNSNMLNGLLSSSVGGASAYIPATDSSGKLTITAGTTISGAAVSLNDNSNFNTSLNTGTSTGTVTIGNTANAGAIGLLSHAAITITGGAASNWTTSTGALTITSAAAATWGTSAGNLSLQAAGASTIADIQIGAGGSGSTTPDFLVLDATSSGFGTGDPTGGANGAMYYNIGLNKFRCFENGAWANCIGAGGSTTLNTVGAATGTATIANAANAIVWNWGTLTTQTGMTFGGGSAMTTGKVFQVGAATFVHTTAETGQAMDVLFTDASTNASGTSITNGIHVGTTINTSGAGVKTINAFSANAPTLTGCASGACTYNGLNAYLQATGTASTITQNGINVTGATIAAGTENGINISAITAGGGAENAIAIGGGWDASITTLANANLVIVPNGSGNVVVNTDANSNMQITATAAPTADMVAISNTGFGVATAGVSNLQLTYVGGASAIEASGERIDITGGTTAGAGSIWNGLRITQAGVTPGTTIGDIKFETVGLTQTTNVTTNIAGIYMAAGTVGAISQTTAAGTINWAGLNLTTPNTTMNFAGGTILNDGVDINMGTYTVTTANAASSGGMNGVDINMGVMTPATGITGTENGIYLATPAHSLTTTGTANINGFRLGSAGALSQATNAGNINWNGANIVMPNITQSAGTITANGLTLTNGTITTAGTENMLNLTAAGVGAGTLNGLNIGNITGGAGTENAINIGTGWNNSINFAGAGQVTTGNATLSFTSSAAGTTNAWSFVDNADITSGTILSVSTTDTAFSGASNTGTLFNFTASGVLTAVSNSLMSLNASGVNTSTTGTMLNIYTNGTSQTMQSLWIQSQTTAATTTMMTMALPGITATSATGNKWIVFTANNGTTQGTIARCTTAGCVAYNTSSDRRIKHDITETHYTLSDLMKINVRDFIMNGDTKVQAGFIAQELYQSYPEAVSPNGDNGTDPLAPGSTPWQVEYGKITPIIVKAVQDEANLLGDFTATGTDLSTFVAATQAEAPRDVVSAFNNDIANGKQFLTDFSSARVTALRGYFDETFANKSHQANLCIGSAANGGETCVTKEQLDALLAGQAPAAPVSSANTTPAPIVISSGSSNNAVSSVTSLAGLIVNSDLNMTGFSISNVLGLSGINGNWSIDQNGVLVQTIKNQNNPNNPSLFATAAQNATITLFGSGKLASGIAHIVFTQEQKEVMAAGAPYNVTVTLTDAANGIYVASKTADGFFVDELNSGTSGATFDWTVIARRVGYENTNDFGLTPAQLAPVVVSPTPTPTPVVTAPPVEQTPPPVVTAPVETTPTPAPAPVATTPAPTDTATPPADTTATPVAATPDTATPASITTTTTTPASETLNTNN